MPFNAGLLFRNIFKTLSSFAYAYVSFEMNKSAMPSPVNGALTHLVQLFHREGAEDLPLVALKSPEKRLVDLVLSLTEGEPMQAGEQMGTKVCVSEWGWVAEKYVVSCVDVVARPGQEQVCHTGRKASRNWVSWSKSKRKNIHRGKLACRAVLGLIV